MTSFRKSSIAIATCLTVAAAGYWMYSASAVQGQGALSQAPMNIQTSVTPAFVMAVDDSGSMTFENLFPGQDGQACFSSGSYFSAPGVLRTSGTCGYNHLIPHTGSRYRIDANRQAVPPVDIYGFARSPTYNPQYFDPNVVYAPWMNQDGTPYPDSDATAARVDPRDATPLINLVGQREDASNTVLLFRFLNGMVIPANTRYFKNANCTGVSGSNSVWISQTTDQTVGATCDIGISYYPAVYYLPDTAPLPAGFRSTSRVLVSNACGTGCNLYKYEIKAANYTSTTAYADAAKNFANWFTYYGNRNRSIIAGMTNSLLDITNMRIGFMRINQWASFDQPLTNTGERVTMNDMAVAANRTSLFSAIIATPAGNSTPNRQAVNAAATQFTRTDAGAPIQYACQKNAVMLFTDGYSNQDGPAVGNVDLAMAPPFSDAWADTMADIASKFYLNANSTVGAAGASSLRPDLAAGKVPVPTGCGAASPDPSLDCQSNLHINFFGVTLGARGNVYNPSLNQNPYADASVYTNWPSRQNDNPSTVDDIWHAAVNTRGEFINAKTPRDITDAMRRILSNIGSGSTPAGSIALAGARIGTDSFTVEPIYGSTNSGTDWYGRLTASTVTSDSVTGQVFRTSLWEASSNLPTPGARRIFVAKTSGNVVPTVSTFAATTVSLDDLCSDALSRCVGTGVARNAITALGITLNQAIDYLRGDQTLETSGSTPLRSRTTRLGDIVNSSPVIASGLNDYGYRSLGGAGSSDPYGYAAYLTAKKTRRPTVFAGANDGMLHAFHGDTGVEQFGYIPVNALSHMGNLLFPYKAIDRADQVFTHRYYVDGPLSLSDAYYGGGWKTVLVGTQGAGGRGVFALDVSTPASFTGANVLWDVNDRATDTNIKNNIGNVLGKPVIVPVKVGTAVSWKAIFGNGYDSINNRAVLFIVDIGTGAVTTVQATEAGLTGPNGLGNIIALDRFVGSTSTAGRDGFADTVYGGDQNGAVWKFDLRSATPTAQTVPFFVATDPSGARQAIIGGFDAAAGPAGGVMLYFGTGSFSFVNDPADRQMQTFYGVLDSSAATPTTSMGRSALQQQTVISDSSGARQTSMLAMGVGKKGWYIDLAVGATSSGERFVGNPRVEQGIVFFPTFDPNSTDACATGGVNRLYGLSSLNGVAALSAVAVGAPNGSSPGTGTGAVQLSTTGSAPVRDVAVMTNPRLGLLSPAATSTEVDDAIAARCTMVVQTAGSAPLYLRRPCGRQSWRQIR